MNKRYYAAPIVFVAATLLAGCQTMQNKGQQESELMQPPAVQQQAAQSQVAQNQQPAQGQSAPNQAAHNQQQSAQGQQARQQVTSVDFRLAQTSPVEGLSEMKFPDGSIWYLPTPVLSRADLAKVEPRRSAENNAYVRFSFNEVGTKKLAMITERYQGNILVLTLNNSLESLVPIQGHITSGILDVGVQNDEQALSMVRSISSSNK